MKSGDRPPTRGWSPPPTDGSILPQRHQVVYPHCHAQSSLTTKTSTPAASVRTTLTNVMAGPHRALRFASRLTSFSMQRTTDDGPLTNHTSTNILVGFSTQSLTRTKKLTDSRPST